MNIFEEFSCYKPDLACRNVWLKSEKVSDIQMILSAHAMILETFSVDAYLS